MANRTIGRLLRSGAIGIGACLLLVGGAQGAFPGVNGEIAINGVSLLTADPTTRTGTSSRTIASGLYPSWSADGAEIAFLRLNGTSPNFALLLMQADGSNVRTIVPTGVYPQRPTWSPDGTRLLYVERRQPGNVYEIWVVNRDGGGRQRLREQASTPAWSPDGNTVAFSGPCALAAKCILLAGPSLSNPRAITQVGVSGATYTYDSWPSWSPDGRALVFERYRSPSGEQPQRGLERSELRVIGADGSGERLLRSSGFSPAWSPDGTKIAFATNADGIGSNIGVIDAQGGSPAFLYPGHDPDWRPCRATTACGPAPPAAVPAPRCRVPNVVGQTLAYAKRLLGQSNCRAGTQRSARSSAALKGRIVSQTPRAGSDLPEGTAVTLVVGLGPKSAPDLKSPPGRFVFATPGGSMYTMRRDGTGLRQLAGGGAREPRWSPDGTRIAFVRLRGLNRTQAQVMVMNADGGGVSELARGAFGPAWSPNGRSLVIWSRIVPTRSANSPSSTPGQETEKPGSLFLLDLRSSSLTPVLRYLGNCKPEFVQHTPTFSPRGNEIAYVTGEPSEHVRAIRTAGAVKSCAGSSPDAPFHATERVIKGASPRSGVSRFIHALRWSPDGRRVLYHEDLGPRRGFPYGGPDRIYVVSSAGGAPRLLAEGTDPTWVGSQKIAFVSPETRTGGGHVMIVNASGGKPTIVRRSQRKGCCTFRYLDWSPRARS